MPELPVTFCIPELEDVDAFASLSPDRDWRAFTGTTRVAWIAQTYARLRDAGHPVTLSRTPPAAGVVVIEATSRRNLFARGLDSRVLLVAVRADHQPQRYADVEIVQNDRFADDRTIHFVPHWPQPGLMPRDPSRGARVETIAFKGHAPNLHADFHSDRWREFLASRGMAWLDEGLPWQGQERRYDACTWNDYSATDLVIAVRGDWQDPCLRKPASKLVNAWQAGVPAILGPEYAYQRLRRSELDYFEVTSLAQAMDAVRRLQREPALYEALVKNGQQRAGEVSVDVVTRRWTELLFDRLVPAALARAAQPGLAWSRRAKRLQHWLARKLPGSGG